MRHTRCALGTGVQTWALPILEDDPYHALAKRYLGGKGGGVCTLGLKGGYDAGVKLVSSVKMFSHLANLGDTRSLIIHPASTTHSQLSEAELVETGAGPDVVRVSVGIAHIDDIIADLAQALEAIGGRTPAPTGRARTSRHCSPLHSPN